MTEDREKERVALAREASHVERRQVEADKLKATCLEMRKAAIRCNHCSNEVETPQMKDAKAAWNKAKAAYSAACEARERLRRDFVDRALVKAEARAATVVREAELAAVEHDRRLRDAEEGLRAVTERHVGREAVEQATGVRDAMGAAAAEAHARLSAAKEEHAAAAKELGAALAKAMQVPA